MLVCVRRRVSTSVCASVFGFGFPFWFDGARGGGGTVGLAGSFVNAKNLSSRSVVIIIIVVVVVVVIIIMTIIVDVHVRKRG